MQSVPVALSFLYFGRSYFYASVCGDFSHHGRVRPIFLLSTAKEKREIIALYFVEIKIGQASVRVSTIHLSYFYFALSKRKSFAFCFFI